MEANKENENRFIPQTRIPLPMEPLPALPRHLLKEINFKAFENSRQPLKTINSQSMPGQSNQMKKCYMKCMTRDYTTDMFNYLICAETKPLEVPRTSSITRACVINWLIKVNGSDGNPAIIHTACWYLDSILGTSQVQLDKLQLVAAACYWIAQKLHGPVLTATRLVKCANHAFSASRLMAAEKVVLQKLKFPTQPVVPQEFITYLSWWCDNNHPGEIEVAATFLCMSGLMVDKALCEEYPSAIAAASVRNALLLLRKRDLMMRLAMCPVYKSAEKKTTNMSYVCSILRRAVRTIAAPIYEYKAPFDHYGIPPNYIAQRIINAANDLAVIDTRVISNDQSTLLTSLYNN
ncbi:uncharacterized protein LOC101739653 isoform X2 [Bombyx mori]|uniref:uncharacterized protein LOC101739653 isoform X2 n=1 Tax=Bombyx mori TaxID=7091 RepID=UPI002ED60735